MKGPVHPIYHNVARKIYNAYLQWGRKNKVSSTDMVVDLKRKKIRRSIGTKPGEDAHPQI